MAARGLHLAAGLAGVRFGLTMPHSQALCHISPACDSTSRPAKTTLGGCVPEIQGVSRKARDAQLAASLGTSQPLWMALCVQTPRARPVAPPACSALAAPARLRRSATAPPPCAAGRAHAHRVPQAVPGRLRCQAQLPPRRCPLGFGPATNRLTELLRRQAGCVSGAPGRLACGAARLR